MMTGCVFLEFDKKLVVEVVAGAVGAAALIPAAVRIDSMAPVGILYRGLARTYLPSSLVGCVKQVN